MDNDFGPCRRNRLHQRICIKRVNHDWRDAQFPQHRDPGGRACRANNLMLRVSQQGR
jgi:hypothetical protein